MILPALLSRPDVDLVIPGLAPADAGVSPWFLVAAAVALTAAAATILFLMQPDDPAERAFTHLARRLRLSRADRRLLRDLAAALGLPGPAPALLSASARSRAAEMLGIPRRVLDALERRVPPL